MKRVKLVFFLCGKSEIGSKKEGEGEKNMSEVSILFICGTPLVLLLLKIFLLPKTFFCPFEKRKQYILTVEYFHNLDVS